jgi:multisubunit Na+/H+ antiporter MnhB subunit
MVIMEEDLQKKIKLEELRNAQILKVVNLATLVSIAMLLFYGIGAYKFMKELKKMK